MKLVFNVFTQNLDYVASTPGDVGIVFPLAPNLGGTGIANAAGSTLTLGAATSITGGGTIGLGGFTLTVPATGTAAMLGIANTFTAAAGVAAQGSAGTITLNSDGFGTVIDFSRNGANYIQADGANANWQFRAAGTTAVYIASAGRVSINSTSVVGQFNVYSGAGGRVVEVLNAHATQSADIWQVRKSDTSVLTSISNVGVGLFSPYTTTNNAPLDALKLQAIVSTASTGGANGFGVGQSFYAETATDGTYRQQGRVATKYVDATNATFKATLVLSAGDSGGLRDGIEIRANGTSPDNVLLGDTWWEGEGFGLPYGSCSSNDTDINWTQASAAQNTWYDISDADMVDGQLNLVTHDGSGQLTVTKAGRYYINYNLVAESSAANDHLETAISVSGTESGFGVCHAQAVTPNAERNFSGTAILDLAANATINLSIRTTDAGTPNLKVEMMDITLVMVGGT